MTAERLCLNCKEIIKGRSDKKFCDDQCRSNHNYALNSTDSPDYIRTVNRILKKNRGILKILNIDGKTRISRELLVTKGFDFSYYTNTFVTEKKNRYFFCYEMGYLVINETEVLLIEKEISSNICTVRYSKKTD